MTTSLVVLVSMRSWPLMPSVWYRARSAEADTEPDRTGGGLEPFRTLNSGQQIMTGHGHMDKKKKESQARDVSYAKGLVQPGSSK